MWGVVPRFQSYCRALRSDESTAAGRALVLIVNPLEGGREPSVGVLGFRFPLPLGDAESLLLSRLLEPQVSLLVKVGLSGFTGCQEKLKELIMRAFFQFAPQSQSQRLFEITDRLSALVLLSR